MSQIRSILVCLSFAVITAALEQNKSCDQCHNLYLNFEQGPNDDDYYYYSLFR